MLKQSIDLPGIGNARELGGYSTGYGRIKPGLLLCTGAMNNMMPDTVRCFLIDTCGLAYSD